MKLQTQLRVICMLFIAVIMKSVSSESHEKRLIEYLFTKYNPMVRPVNDSSQPININVGLFLEAIKDVNERESTITISGWLDMEWQDENLCWNPTDFGNITFVLVRGEKLWRSDIAFNSAVGARIFYVTDNFIGLHSSCKIDFAPGGLTTHPCDFDVTLFPFDTQTCKFFTGTWFSTDEYVKLLPRFFVYDESKSNELWEIVSSKVDVTVSGVDGPTQVEFTLKIRRKPLYYIIYVIIPLLMLAFLNIMVFRLPSASGGKVSLSITILLAIAIWLTMLNDFTPRSSDSIPILGMFITALMILSVLSTAVAVYVVRIYNFDRKRPLPTLARHIARYFEETYRGRNSEAKNDPPPAAVSWQSVSLAVDHLAFIVVSFLTALLIATCIVGFIVIKEQN